MLPQIKGAQMSHFLEPTSQAPPATLTVTKDGKEEQIVNMARVIWYAQQQQLQGFLMGSLSREILAQVVMLQTPSEVWAAIHAMFAAQSQAQAINTRIALHNLQKGSSSMADYLAKVKSLTNEIACAGGVALSDGEITSHILAGLDLDYNPVVSVLAARVEPVTVQELYSQLLSFDARMNLLHGLNPRQSSANAASRERNTGGRGQQGHGRSNSSSGRGRGGSQSSRSGTGGGGYNRNQITGGGGGGYNHNQNHNHYGHRGTSSSNN